MILGVTGTRDGLSQVQRRTALALLADLQPEWLHHGDCVGVDADLHAIATEHAIPVTVHPPDMDQFRAHCHGAINWRPRPYLTRDHDIVDCCSALLAFPGGAESLRSGTWATVRYAIREGKMTIIVYPNGQTEQR